MEKDVLFLLKKATDGVERLANNSLKDKNITLAQCGFLSYLNEKENNIASLKELEKHFEVSQATLQGTAARLECKKLIELVGDAKDKRIKLAKLTALGREAFKEADRLRAKNDEFILADFTEDEKKVFKELLLKVHKKIQP